MPRHGCHIPLKADVTAQTQQPNSDSKGEPTLRASQFNRSKALLEQAFGFVWFLVIQWMRYSSVTS